MEDEIYLQLYPLRQFEWKEDTDENRVVIIRPKVVSNWAKKFLKPFFKDATFKIKLDAIGSVVWRNCDGTKTVAEILQILEQNFPDEKELQKRLLMFVRQLTRDKFIILLEKVKN